MKKFLYQYKAFGLGLLIIIGLTVLLEKAGFIRIGNDPIENTILFGFWWVMISLPIHRLDYLKRQLKLLQKIGGLVFLLGTMIIIDSQMDIPDNPVTVALITLFWLGVASLVFPRFFKKYRRVIAGIYVLALGYFLYVRTIHADVFFEVYKERSIIQLLLPVPALFTLWVYEQWRHLRELKREKSKAELALLKNQVNPHFFFNTLNNLYALTVAKSDQAAEVVVKLSDMMRYSIYEGQQETVSIAQEKEYLEQYLELHKIRYQKEVDISFEQDIDDLQLEIAPLLFIIPLENALKHGVEKLRSDAFVQLYLESNGGEVFFSVKNNFDPEEQEEGKGIGLANLRKRLELLYPKKHRLTVESTEELFNVEIKIDTK